MSGLSVAGQAETGSGTWRVCGHAKVVESLSRSLDRPAHAYLFLGPRRVGKTAMAIELAKALNCLADLRPCQACSECRLIDGNGHPDVTILLPNEKENVLIEQARQLRQEVALLPNQGRKRVVVLPGDRLTEPAADALLKTLEEPPDHVVLVLTGHDLDGIPETVVSRCRMVPFGFVGAGDIEAELVRRGVDGERAARLAALAFGAPGWAIEAATNDEMVDRRQSIEADLRSWTSGALLDRLRAAESLAASGAKLELSRAAAMEELELMLIWWRDVLAATTGHPELAGETADRDEIARVAAGETAEGAVRVIRAISLAASRIQENVDPRLALEAMAIGFESDQVLES